MIGELRRLLTVGDRRSIADSNRVRAILEKDPARVGELAALAEDEEWLIAQRAVDLMEKLAHDHPEWIEPYKKIFIGPLADSDKWEVLNSKYKDDNNVSLAKPNETKIQGLIKKFNRDGKKKKDE